MKKEVAKLALELKTITVSKIVRQARCQFQTVIFLHFIARVNFRLKQMKKSVLVLLFLETSSLPKSRPLPYVILFFQTATLKVQLFSAGKPGGFAKLDQNGRLPQNVLTAGYDQYSAFDLAWQSVHMAAAAA